MNGNYHNFCFKINFEAEIKLNFTLAWYTIGRLTSQAGILPIHAVCVVLPDIVSGTVLVYLSFIQKITSLVSPLEFKVHIFKKKVCTLKITRLSWLWISERVKQAIFETWNQKLWTELYFTI